MIALSILVIGVIILFGKSPNSLPINTTAPATTNSDEAISTWQTYQNTQHRFEMSYPDSFAVMSLDPTKFEESLAGYGGVVKFLLSDPDLKDGTNLSEVAVSVAVVQDSGNGSCALSDASDLSADKLGQLSALGLMASKVIGGVKFARAVTTDAEAGNFYNQIIYTSTRNNLCYKLVIFLHWLNIHNFTPGAVREFDYDQVVAAAAEVLESFKLLP